MKSRPLSIVVGIDGSQAAIEATEWAVDEAISRDLSLRLVCAIPTEVAAGAPAEDFRMEVEYAEAALRAADAAVQATGIPVKVETAVIRGRPDAVLLAESRDADMVCVGSVGIGTGRVARLSLGSTAAALAEGASCPVAIIRPRQDSPSPGIEWIAVVIDDSPDNDAVVERALQEARRRAKPVLAVGVWREDVGETPHLKLGPRVDAWRRRYPDVHIYPVATRSGVAQFLADSDETVPLTVIGADDADQVATLIGRHGHPIQRHADCVLVVR